ncbi:PML-RARA-regulated adapter molecule 1 [Etheostoma spectabile]|uniref:PML-RARA-regulated adapter molecule 1 n=1 Tax=Etheostoma spectabile TaxID=54343 RepID=UPI0013AF9745|nr:PML-RARA-regulated adapter molecule 1-like [Etheostoma spectabile]
MENSKVKQNKKGKNKGEKTVIQPEVTHQTNLTKESETLKGGQLQQAATSMDAPQPAAKPEVAPLQDGAAPKGLVQQAATPKDLPQKVDPASPKDLPQKVDPASPKDLPQKVDPASPKDLPQKVDPASPIDLPQLGAEPSSIGGHDKILQTQHSKVQPDTVIAMQRNFVWRQKKIAEGMSVEDTVKKYVFLKTPRAVGEEGSDPLHSGR